MATLTISSILDSSLVYQDGKIGARLPPLTIEGDYTLTAQDLLRPALVFASTTPASLVFGTLEGASGAVRIVQGDGAAQAILVAGNGAQMVPQSGLRTAGRWTDCIATLLNGDTWYLSGLGLTSSVLTWDVFAPAFIAQGDVMQLLIQRPDSTASVARCSVTLNLFGSAGDAAWITPMAQAIAQACAQDGYTSFEAATGQLTFTPQSANPFIIPLYSVASAVQGTRNLVARLQAPSLGALGTDNSTTQVIAPTGTSWAPSALLQSTTFPLAAAVPVGASQIQLDSCHLVCKGASVTGPGIATGTVVQDRAGLMVTLSLPTTEPLPRGVGITIGPRGFLIDPADTSRITRDAANRISQVIEPISGAALVQAVTGNQPVWQDQVVAGQPAIVAAPLAPVTLTTSAATSASVKLNFTTVPSNINAGNVMTVTGTGIPAGTTLASTAATSVNLSTAVTVDAGTVITFTPSKITTANAQTLVASTAPGLTDVHNLGGVPFTLCYVATQADALAHDLCAWGISGTPYRQVRSNAGASTAPDACAIYLADDSGNTNLSSVDTQAAANDLHVWMVLFDGAGGAQILRDGVVNTVQATSTGASTVAGATTVIPVASTTGLTKGMVLPAQRITGYAGGAAISALSSTSITLNTAITGPIASGVTLNFVPPVMNIRTLAAQHNAPIAANLFTLFGRGSSTQITYAWNGTLAYLFGTMRVLSPAEQDALNGYVCARFGIAFTPRPALDLTAFTRRYYREDFTTTWNGRAGVDAGYDNRQNAQPYLPVGSTQTANSETALLLNNASLDSTLVSTRTLVARAVGGVPNSTLRLLQTSSALTDLFAAVDTDATQFPYVGACATTLHEYAQTLGYWECSALMPLGDGAWPAFWLLAADGTRFEVDGLELYGRTPGLINVGFFPRLSPAAGAASPGYGQGGVMCADTTLAYHRYGVSIDPDYISFWFDGVRIWQAPASFDCYRDVYALLDLTTGGFVGNPLAADLPLEMGVRYVAAYQRTESTTGTASGVQAETTAILGVMANTQPQYVQDAINDFVLWAKNTTTQMGSQTFWAALDRLAVHAVPDEDAALVEWKTATKGGYGTAVVVASGGAASGVSSITLTASNLITSALTVRPITGVIGTGVTGTIAGTKLTLSTPLTGALAAGTTLFLTASARPTGMTGPIFTAGQGFKGTGNNAYFIDQGWNPSSVNGNATSTRLTMGAVVLDAPGASGGVVQMTSNASLNVAQAGSLQAKLNAATQTYVVPKAATDPVQFVAAMRYEFSTTAFVGANNVPYAQSYISSNTTTGLDNEIVRLCPGAITSALEFRAGWLTSRDVQRLYGAFQILLQGLTQGGIVV